jgi:plasmid stability protein
MSLRTLRITVRGSFRNLTDDQRAELRARAAEHDVLHASFTAEGQLAYDVDARAFFTYRFLREARSDEDVAPAVAGAEAAARTALEQRGLGYELRSTQVQDLSQAPLSKRQRRTRG